MTRPSIATVFIIYLFVFLVNVAAVPITPSAADVERLAERMRAEGVSERDIASRLSSSNPSPDPGTFDDDEDDTLEPPPTRLQSFFSLPFNLNRFYSSAPKAYRDTSGDLSPGSLESPSMLPRSLNIRPSKRIGIIEGVFTRRMKGMERDFAYEGMEGRVRRPVGMRHWNWGARGYVFV